MTKDPGLFDYNHPKGTFDWNISTHEFICSHRLNRILGFTPQAKIGYDDFTDSIHPEDKHIWDHTISNNFPRENFKLEVRIPQKDQTMRWARFCGKISYDHRNLPLRLHGNVQDITEVKALFSELRESEQKFRLLADAMPLQVWTSDPKGEFNFFNQAVYNYTGLDFQQIKSGGWSQLLHPDDYSESEKIWADAISSGKECVMQHRLRNFLGDYRWHQSRAIPQKDSQGDIQMWVGTTTDIEGQKNFVKELEQKIKRRTRSLIEENAHLTKTNNELQQFAYIASHDLQEPLRKIITFSNRIQQQYNQDMPEGSKAYLDKIITSSQRMTRLIEDLLNFSTVAGSDEQFTETDLNHVLEFILVDFEEQIQARQASITSENLPVICANTVQISQLFQNLISNALKFSKPDTAPCIHISSRTLSAHEIQSYSDINHDKTYVEILVQDNGIGFEQQYADKIFNIFQRLDHEQKYKGTGIGLALCKKIAENHQGIITVKSAPGKGSEFHIILPL